MIDEILLVGGSTKVPLVQRMMKEKYGAKVNSSVDPMLSIGMGASILAHRLDDSYEAPEMGTLVLKVILMCRILPIMITIELEQEGGQRVSIRSLII